MLYNETRSKETLTVCIIVNVYEIIKVTYDLYFF